MSSTYYLNKKNQCANVKAKVQNTLAYFDNCISRISKCSSYLEDITIDEKSFDDGKLGEQVTKLSNAKQDMLTIINECDTKIREYESLYQSALAEEKAAAEEENGSSS